MPRRRRRRKEKPLEEAALAIYRALCQAGLTDQAKRLRILQSWADAVGPDIAARTAPQNFSRGVLVVKAATPTWQNELTFLKAGILARLNEIIGKRVVRDIKIISGTLSPTSGGERATHKAKPAAEDFAAARELAAAIGDPSVRAAFERAAAADSAHRRGVR